MIKLFVTDLDGTLLGVGNIIIPENKQAIQELAYRQIAFGVASGRMDRDIAEITSQLGESGHRVSQNGGFVFDGEGNQLHAKTFSSSFSRQLYTAIQDFGATLSVSTANEVYVSELTEEIKQFEHLLFFPVIEEKDLGERIGKDIFPSKFTLHGETEDLMKMKEQIDAFFPGEMESYLSDPHCVDFVPKGISKAQGLQILLDRLEIKPEEMAVIGDSFNDVPMLEMTPHSFAMSTAPEEVKNRASHVVRQVHEAIEHVMKQQPIGK